MKMINSTRQTARGPNFLQTFGTLFGQEFGKHLDNCYMGSLPRQGSSASYPPPAPGRAPCRPPMSGSTSQRRLAASTTVSASASPSTTNLVVVGDVHSQWDDVLDRAALDALSPDAVLFVGDLGNQDVALVSRIASLKDSYNLAAILGNHDAWYCLTDRGRKRAIKNALQSSNLAQFSSLGDTGEYTAKQIHEMLEVLGSSHVGYGAKSFPGVDCVFAGARPFSKGGVQWSAVKAFYEKYYSVSSMEESAERILDVMMGVDGGEGGGSSSPLVMLAHNGPSGLGGRKYDPCGVDFMEPEDDFGDPDLEEALETAYLSCGKRAALVTFGHMHSRLKHGGMRNMVVVDARMGPIYLNAAVVPRVASLREASLRVASLGESSLTRRHFARVRMADGVVVKAENVWVHVDEEGGIVVGEDAGCILEKVDNANRYRVFQAHTGEWTEVDVQA